LKYILIPTFFILCAEVILYSQGILQYKELSWQEYGGIMRISTTVGASTGTGIVLFALGVFVLQHYIHRPAFQYVFLGIWGTSLLYTISRSIIICFLLFAAIYLWKNVTNLKFSKKIIFISGIILVFLTLNYFNVFEPVVEREKLLQASNDILSGRDELYMLVLKPFETNPLFGVGIGNVFPTKDVRQSDFVPLYFAPLHNYWLLTLGEQGIVGFFCFLFVCVTIIRKLNYSNCCSYAVLLIIFVSMNTEAIFVDDEFIAPLFLLVSTSLKSNANINYKKVYSRPKYI
jgi:O-antigen ligase